METYTTISSNNDVRESSLLTRAVRSLITRGGGQIGRASDGQAVMIDLSTSPISIHHVEHGRARDRGLVKEERAFLLLVGKQVQGFLHKPVVIEDSEDREITFGGLVDEEFEKYKELPKDTILEITGTKSSSLYGLAPGIQDLGTKFTIKEALDPSVRKFVQDESTARKDLAWALKKGLLKVSKG